MYCTGSFDTADSGMAPVAKSFSVHGETDCTPATLAASKTRARNAACSPSVFCSVFRPVSPITIGLGETVLADCERFLGPGHWETLSTRANLAHAYHSAGKLKRASAQFDRALRDCEQALGTDDTLTGEVRVLRNRYLAGRQGAAPIITAPAAWIRASQQGRVSGQDGTQDWPAGLQL